MNSPLTNSVFRIAVIGSGPSGFYAAEELLAQSDPKICVDMYDALPTPFGLVRGGVAPDHQKIKTVTRVYEKTAAREGFRFFGNVEFGRDISLDELKSLYSAVILAVGARSDRKMEIPGEDLQGSFPATEFVGWYNGHPDYRHLKFDLSCERVAVVGNGNVAMDVARILASDPKILEQTDIAGYALEALRASRVKEIYLLGRRGPAQAAFTNPEIRELCELPGADLVVDPKESELDPLSNAEFQTGSLSPAMKNNVQILKEHSAKPLRGEPKKVIARFLVSPVELIGKDGKVSAMKLEKNQLHRTADGSLRPKGAGIFETIPVDMVLRSVGYMGVALPGVPFNAKKGTVPNELGRVKNDKDNSTVTGLYVVGWAKRGPSGVIGTNKPDSIETARNLLEDLRAGKVNQPSGSDEKSVPEFLRRKNVRAVSFTEWKSLDAMELEKGKSKGRPRDKFTEIKEMLAALDSAGKK